MARHQETHKQKVGNKNAAWTGCLSVYPSVCLEDRLFVRLCRYPLVTLVGGFFACLPVVYLLARSFICSLDWFRFVCWYVPPCIILCV